MTTSRFIALAIAVVSPLLWQSSHGQMYVYFDPGHGGDDPGRLTHISGYAEKDINLEVGLELEIMLDVYPSYYTPVFSRTTDATVYNTQRAYEANGLNCLTLLSIHHNGSTNPSVNCTTVLYSTLPECDGSGNPWLGHSRNTTSLFARKVGYRLRDGFDYTLHENSPWDYEDSITVLSRTFMASALSEASFVSNPDEAELFYYGTGHEIVEALSLYIAWLSFVDGQGIGLVDYNCTSKSASFNDLGAMAKSTHPYGRVAHLSGGFLCHYVIAVA